MSIPYSPEYTPPAPILPVTFGLSGERPSFGPYNGFVDSGADISIVPRLLLVDWGIPSVAEASLRGQWSERRVIRLYLVDLAIAGLRLRDVYVAGDDDGDEIIIGRNILNKLPLFLDGPERQTDMLNDAAANRLRARR